MKSRNSNETVGAKIRNSLSPTKNLSCMIEELFGTKEKPKNPDFTKRRNSIILDAIRESSEDLSVSVDRIVELSEKHCEFVPKK